MSVRRYWVGRLTMDLDVNATDFGFIIYSEQTKLPQGGKDEPCRHSCPHNNKQNAEQSPAELIEWSVETSPVFPTFQVVGFIVRATYVNI